MNDQASKLREMMQIRKNSELRFLTVTGANSPVGKSSIAFNLAVTMRGMGRRTMLIRVDTRSRGEIAASRDTLAFLLENDIPLKGRQGLDRDGVLHLLGGNLAALLALSSKLTCSGFAQLGEFADVVIFDVEPGNPDLTAQMIAATGQALLIVSPQQTPLVDCYGIVRSLTEQRAAGAAVSLLLNKAPEREAAWQILENFAGTLNKKTGMEIAWLGWVPLDASVALADELRQPFVTAYPQSMAARAMTEVAHGYLNMPNGRCRLFEQAEIFG